MLLITLTFGLLYFLSAYTSFNLVRRLLNTENEKEKAHQICETQALFIWGLAVSSIFQNLFGFFVLFLSSMLYQSISGPFCILDGFVTSACSYVVISQFAVLAIQQQKTKCIQKYSYWLLALCWISAALLSSLPLFGIGNYEPHGNNTFCCLNWNSNDDEDKTYFIALFIFAFFCPAAIILGSKFMQKGDKEGEEKSRKIYIFDVAMVLLCMWLPYGIAVIYMLSGSTISGNVEFITIVIALSSFIVIPSIISRRIDTLYSKLK